MAAQNPAQKVPEPLRRHLHLKSKHQYPAHPQLGFPAIVDYLSNARQVVRNVAPMQWSYLNCPPDGSVMLFWQMPDEPGFGSDGYVWGDVETTFSEMHGNFVLEVRSHRTGFRPGEAVATHARQRYRLRPTSQEALDQFDPSLWLVYWSRAHQTDHAQSERMPVSAAMKALMEERKAIEKAGVPVRKEFMLSDAANYPSIVMPPPLSQFIAGRAAKEGQPAAKRQRRDARSRLHEVMEDESEDRDLFDVLTPRDVSIMRYTKHSDWMEELMASPFSTSQILPVSLGLGRTGALAAMTKDFFDAPVEHTILAEGEEYADEEEDDDDDAPATDDDIAQPISADKAAEFAARAEAQVASINAEIEALKREHEERLAQLGRTAAIREAEARLRSADSGAAIDAVVRDAEKLLGRSVDAQRKFQLVQRGGLVDRTPTPSPSPQPEEDPEEDQDPQDTDMADGAEFNDDPAFGDPAFADPAAFAAFTNPDADFGSAAADSAASAGAAGAAPSPPHPAGEGDWEVIDRAEAASAPTSAGLPPGSAPAAPSALAAAIVPAADDGADQGEDTSMDLGDGLIDFGDDDAGDDAGPDGGEFGDSLDFGDLGADDGMDGVAADLADASGGPEPAAPAADSTDAAAAPPAQAAAPAADLGQAAALEGEAPEAAAPTGEAAGEMGFADEAFGNEFDQA